MTSPRASTPRPHPLQPGDLASRLANEAYWQDVFRNSEPKREIKPGSHYVSLPGWFPTRKNARSRVRTRSPLARDLMFHLETDPDVVAVADFPVETSYRSRTASGFRVELHVPEIAALRRDGSVLVLDAVPLHVQLTKPGIRQRTADLKEAYLDLGATYRCLDETSLQLEPLLSNLKTMWKHKQTGHELAGMAALRQWILDADLPATIGGLMRSAPLNAVLARWSDEPDAAARHVTENNPVFSAVMQLAIAGLVDVDLDSPFSPATTVTRRERAHVRL